MSVGSQASIHDRAAFDFVRYGSVWEDAQVLCDALAPVARGRRVLSIASAGDNVLALLTLDPSEVVAVDLSEAQLACLELRMAAFRSLEYEDRLAFLGVLPATDRPAVYGSVRESLTPRGRTFWDSNPRLIEAGPIHVGKFERYLRSFRRFILPLIHSSRTMQEISQLETLEAQQRFYEERWDTWRWRLLFRLFFSRFVMGRMGRDPEFFTHVEGSVGDRILERTRWALTQIPVRTNPWFQYIMTGNFLRSALPLYLRPESEAPIRSRLDRVRLLAGSVTEAEGRFSAFNLSDLFEYMSPSESAGAYGALLERAEPGARLVYWNMLAPRRRPDVHASRVHELTPLAQELHARDRAWFYQWLRVDEVDTGARGMTA